MTIGISRRGLASGALATGIGGPAAVDAGGTPGLVHDADAIHQTVAFSTPPARVYDALTEAERFEKVFRLGAAARTMRLGSAPTAISPDVGGAFTLFGGYIVGRHLHLARPGRIVQAWREITWDDGQFSLVSFRLAAAGGGTLIDFDHTGFPAGAGPHLSIGWYENYWDPLRKYLG
jgi:activator of HSP90 ATPase